MPVEPADALRCNFTSVTVNVLLLTDQLDTATKHRAAKEAERSDQKQHVFLKLLEQSEFSVL